VLRRIFWALLGLLALRSVRALSHARSRGPRNGDNEDRRVGEYYEDRERALGNLRGYRLTLGHVYRARLAHILALLVSLPGGDMIDVGCGAGSMLEAIVRTRGEDFRLTGIDRSHAMIEVARARLSDQGDVRLEVGRAEALPFPDESFDLTLAMGVLEYTRLPEATRELSRVTRPGGLVIATMQNPWSPYRLWERVAFRHLRALLSVTDSPVLNRVGERALRDMFAENGLLAFETKYYDFNVFLRPLDEVLPNAAMGVSRGLERVGTGPLRRLGNGYILALRRDT
jgi:ubiquinone/menaquinone biosynthesis C-methylase UbiE